MNSMKGDIVQHEGKHVSVSVRATLEDGIIGLSIVAGMREHVSEFADHVLTPDDVDDDLARLVAAEVEAAVKEAIRGETKRQMGMAVLVDFYSRVDDEELMNARHELLAGGESQGEELAVVVAEAEKRGLLS